MEKPKTYAGAGVDIEKGDRFAKFIGSVESKAISKGLGGFAGGIEIDTERYRKPVLLSCTDGVGTKLIVAQNLKKYDTVGIDLVAMSVNDLIVCGAAPLVFLDYIACGSIDESLLQDLVGGVIRGCEEAECTLAGGETAEMPDLYSKEDFDLAGFCVGIVEKSKMLPRTSQITPGDTILGLPSAGIHSNGLSLARKVISDVTDPAYKELLTPTKIYVKELMPLIETGLIAGAAHITGGGLESNILRIMPEHMGIELTWDWTVPGIFTTIEQRGPVEPEEMRKVFNMGIGIAVVVSQDNAAELKDTAADQGTNLIEIGRVTLKES